MNQIPYYMTRGDSQNVTVSINGYTLTQDDVVTLTVRKTVSSPIVLQRVAGQYDEGKAIIDIAPEDTAEIPWGEYVYDIQVSYASGDVVTIVTPSRFTLGEEVTYDG